MHCLCPDFASEGDHLYCISANNLEVLGSSVYEPLVNRVL